MATEYKPVKEEPLQPTGIASAKSLNDSIITLMTWNIGYASMGAETDFFYDGGKMVRPDKGLNTKYLNSIQQYFRSSQLPDFILLQEVDKNAKRSYFTDQTEILRSLFAGFSSVFAINYNVHFVPMPVSKPMGRVLAGMMTFSFVEPATSERVSFPVDYDWPARIFTLKRCFILQRFPARNGRELVIINTHNSAFDKGNMRQIQLETLRQTAIEEFAKGNWVIIGGDWNMNPPGFDPTKISSVEKTFTIDAGKIPTDFMPVGWKWVFDPEKPTNREVITSYEMGKTPTTIIDFFLISPNVEVIEISSDYQSFAISDHHPVHLKAFLTDFSDGSVR